MLGAHPSLNPHPTKSRPPPSSLWMATKSLSPFFQLCTQHAHTHTHKNMGHEWSRDPFPELRSNQVTHAALYVLAFEAARTCPLTSQSHSKCGLWISQTWVCLLGGLVGDGVTLDKSGHLPEPFPHLGNEAATASSWRPNEAPGWGVTGVWLAAAAPHDTDWHCLDPSCRSTPAWDARGFLTLHLGLPRAPAARSAAPC